MVYSVGSLSQLGRSPFRTTRSSIPYLTAGLQLNTTIRLQGGKGEGEITESQVLDPQGIGGNYALILDETRIQRKDVLEILSSVTHGMVVGEEEAGNFLWAKLANLDIDNIIECNKPETIKGFALPRLFKRKTLDLSLNKLKENPTDKFFSSGFS